MRVTVAKLIEATKDYDDGSTLSISFVRAIGRDSDEKRRIRVVSATLGDSPIFISDGIKLHIMPVHSSLYFKKDIKYIKEQSNEAYETGDQKHLFKNVWLNEGCVWINANSLSLTRKLSMTRALGYSEFGLILKRKADVNSYDLNSDDFVCLASDGVFESLDPESISAQMKKLISMAKDGADAAKLGKYVQPTRDNATIALVSFTELS